MSGTDTTQSPTSRVYPYNLSCSFCGKSQKEVHKLIAGPMVYICNECIGLCNDILFSEQEDKREVAARKRVRETPLLAFVQEHLAEKTVGELQVWHVCAKVDELARLMLEPEVSPLPVETV